jgi:hypothetical protein
MKKDIDVFFRLNNFCQESEKHFSSIFSVVSITLTSSKPEKLDPNEKFFFLIQK